MKVLYISHVTILSGSTIALLNIIRQMTGRGVTVGVVIPERNGWLYEQLTPLNVDILDIGEYYPWLLEKPKADGIVDYIRKNRDYARYILHFHKKFYHLIKDYNPDLVHCNNGTIDYALYACWRLKIPHVWHVREYQDLDFHFNTYPCMRFLRWKMHRPFVHCIAITKGVFEHFHLGKKDCVIYDGVIDIGKTISLNSENFPYPYFLFTGAVIRGKGLHVVLEQFGRFLELHPDVHLLVTSTLLEEDEYSIYCKQLARDGHFESHIHYLGRRNDIYDLMQNAIAQIVPSYFEGFGFITAEAMYNHCLVIGRDTAGTKEQFDNGVKWTGEEIGLRFREEAELPSLMEKAITNDYQTLKERAYKCVSDNYTSKACADKILTYYNTLL